MLYIKIHQLNIENEKCFMNLDFLRSFFKQDAPNLAEYACKYADFVDADSLEDVFYIFNMNHPADYKGRSLSVSDIVEVVNGSDDILPGFYFCDSYCWKKINTK